MEKKLAKATTQLEQNVQDEQLNTLIIEAIQDVKGLDIVKLDLTTIPDTVTKYIIICHGKSTTQVGGIAKRVESLVWDNIGLKPHRVEGRDGRNWMVVDYFSTMVHIFTLDKRQLYDLEDLWSDAIATYYKD